MSNIDWSILKIDTNKIINYLAHGSLNTIELITEAVLTVIVYWGVLNVLNLMQYNAKAHWNCLHIQEFGYIISLVSGNIN